MLYAFDGTWNDDRNRVAWTNVCKLANAMAPAAVRYYRGVGSGADCRGLAKLVDGAFGLGFSEIIDKALDDFRAARAAGDLVIDALGFSRGSTAALVFLNKVREFETKAKLKPAQRARIRFVGLFDAVDALGLPDVDWEFWYDKRLAKDVEIAVHAVALHETRATFQCLDVKGARQVAFRGNHCDVGGGYAEPGLSDVSLGWMYDQAAAAGVAFATARSALGLKPKPAMAPHRVTAFNYHHEPRTLPAGIEMPADPSPWPIMRLVGSAKGASGGKGGTPVTPDTWEFINHKGFTPD
jgi:uncharacterized protein (DUF2235 family)